MFANTSAQNAVPNCPAPNCLVQTVRAKLSASRFIDTDDRWSFFLATAAEISEQCRTTWYIGCRRKFWSSIFKRVHFHHFRVESEKWDMTPLLRTAFESSSEIERFGRKKVKMTRGKAVQNDSQTLNRLDFPNAISRKPLGQSGWNFFRSSLLRRDSTRKWIKQTLSLQVFEPDYHLDAILLLVKNGRPPLLHILSSSSLRKLSTYTK